MKLTTPFTNKPVWYGSISTSIILVGVLLLSLRTWIFDAMVDHVVLLGPDTEATKAWTVPPTTLYLDFYLFNWTNPEEINDPSKKPKFEEIGPYRFIDKKEKVNITWNNNDTVSYRISHTWLFDEEGSPRKLTDMITTVNIVLLMASKQVRHWNYWTKRGFSFSLATIGSHVHVTKTAKELLFDGYQDNLLDMAQSFSFLSKINIPYNKVGFLVERNGSYTRDGLFNVATGAKGNNGELLNWNYNNYTETYEAPCNRVRGSAIDLFNQKLSRDSIEMFSTETCGTIKLHYENDFVINGIDGYRFSAQDKIFDNGTNIPENKCFLQGELPTGVQNITACTTAEVFVSLPHYYGADPLYTNSIDGLKPNKEKHDLHMTIEPRIGLVLEVVFRLQSNFLLEPVEYLTEFEKVPRVFIPTVWFEQRYVIPDSMTTSIKLLLDLPLIIIVFGGILVVSGVLGLMYAVILSKRIRTNNYNVQHMQYNNKDQVLTEKKLKHGTVVIEKHI